MNTPALDARLKIDMCADLTALCPQVPQIVLRHECARSERRVQQVHIRKSYFAMNVQAVSDARSRYIFNNTVIVLIVAVLRHPLVTVVILGQLGLYALPCLFLVHSHGFLRVCQPVHGSVDAVLLTLNACAAAGKLLPDEVELLRVLLCVSRNMYKHVSVSNQPVFVPIQSACMYFLPASQHYAEALGSRGGCL